MTTTQPSTLRFLDCTPAAGQSAAQVLADAGVRPEEVLAVEVFYDTTHLDTAGAHDLGAALAPDRPVPVSTVPTTVAVIGEGPARMQATVLAPGGTARTAEDGSHAVAGPVVATALVEAPDAGDIVAQSHAVLGRIGEILRSHGLGLDDVVKFNIYYRGDGTQEDWAVAARVRAEYFAEPGPATTGIPVVRFEDERVLIAMQVVAIGGIREQRRHSWPEGHWDWPFHLPYKHGLMHDGMVLIGGQVPTDDAGRVLHAGDFAAQVRMSLDYIDAVLRDLDVPRSAVQRMTAYMATTAEDGPARWSELREQVSAFVGGPVALVPVPLPALAYEEMDIEIEVQAQLG